MRKLSCVIVLGAMLALVGCSPKEQEQQEPALPADSVETSAAQTATADAGATQTGQQQEKNTESPTTASETEDITPEKAKSYYGKWEVTACAGTSEVYALSQEEIDERIGYTISYEENAVIEEGGSIEIAGYEEETKTADSFQKDYGITFDSLGITGLEEMTCVTVMAEGNYFGAYFMVKNDTTLIIYYEGVFFEAVLE